MVHGELEQATKENPLLLKNVCITKKLGFSDVIMPGDVRYVVRNVFAYGFIRPALFLSSLLLLM